MNLEQAIAKHAEWKVKFRAAISQKQKLDAVDIARDNCCDLGRWLHGDGRTQYAALPSFQTCMSNHVAFHAEAGRVAIAINAGNYANAETMLASSSAFTAASGKVAMAIRQLKKDAEH